nr:hypothetical protein [Tanacetum cinerariifolium]
MDMDCIGDLGFLDPKLLQLNEVSLLAIKSNHYVVEKLFAQWFSIPETTLLVIIKVINRVRHDVAAWPSLNPLRAMASHGVFKASFVLDELDMCYSSALYELDMCNSSTVCGLKYVKGNVGFLNSILGFSFNRVLWFCFIRSAHPDPLMGWGGRGVKEKDGVAQSPKEKEKSEVVKDDVAPSVMVESGTEDVGNVSVWVNLYGVPMTAFSKDGLSVIPTNLGTPLMLESYTYDMCNQSWGRSSYARAMVEIREDVELNYTIIAAMPKHIGEGFYTCKFSVEYEWKPSRCASCKVFGYGQDECPKYIDSGGANNVKKPSQAPQTNANTGGGKKKDVELPKDVSNSNPFDVPNLVDDDLGTNGRTSNLASKNANSSGSSFWNVGSSSLSTTPIVEKIDKIEKLIIDGQVTLVDDEGKTVEKVGYLGDHDSEDEVASTDNDMTNFLALGKVGYGDNSLLEKWRDSYRNGDYDFDLYNDDMYEDQDMNIPDKIQEICNNLDIKVKGRKKK